MTHPMTLERRVVAGTDDAEERTSGKMDLASTDLDLTDDSAGGAIGQTIGIRFTGSTSRKGPSSSTPISSSRPMKRAAERLR
jgi:hypothetical protein